MCKKERNMGKFIFVAIATLIATAAYAEPIVDVLKIAGKSESEVASYLGASKSCGKSKYGNKCEYTKGETEVVFINGKADWITVEGIDSVPFSKSALTVLGLKEANPSFKNNL
jgi:hypothetical protein